ncbi:hypothetical protein PSTT_08050 [Puccinia striiformis]|uniref:Branched-chain-amino-acid transaminase n=1 Tax=Puccinia striiformis TaxID=27350 RepID=A0A2S4VE55_9BASI|nr:hypothetical protein PSTT_08050 [Puccinia striiformis]
MEPEQFCGPLHSLIILGDDPSGKNLNPVEIEFLSGFAVDKQSWSNLTASRISMCLYAHWHHAKLDPRQFQPIQPTTVERSLNNGQPRERKLETNCFVDLTPSSISHGVGPPSELTLFVICSLVGPYYRTGFKPVSLLASSKSCRAWPGGSGAFKLGANYPTGFLPQMEANHAGYEQILWLFGENDNLTEVGTMNLFVALKDESGTLELVIPPLDDKILPGVTRDSVLELLRDHLNGSQRLDRLPTNFKVSNRPITMIEMLEKSRTGHLKEVFETGTAAIVSSVERIGYKGKDIHIPIGPGGLGLFANVVQREILGRQTGEIPSDWAVVV